MNVFPYTCYRTCFPCGTTHFVILMTCWSVTAAVKQYVTCIHTSLVYMQLSLCGGQLISTIYWTIKFVMYCTMNSRICYKVKKNEVKRPIAVARNWTQDTWLVQPVLCHWPLTAWQPPTCTPTAHAGRGCGRLVVLEWRSTSCTISPHNFSKVSTWGKII